MITNENEESKVNTTIGAANKVDWKVINSADWIQKFNCLTNNPQTNKTLCDKSREILKERSGTDRETMYFIDSSNGKVFGKSSEPKEDLCVFLDEDLIYRLNLNGGNRLIGVHNHPQGNVPSLNDLNAIVGRSAMEKGIVVCHNGIIYSYTKPIQVINGLDYDIALKKNRGYSNITSQEISLYELGEIYGFIFRRL